MRSISRICDLSINTGSKLLVDAGKFCANLHDREVRNVTWSMDDLCGMMDAVAPKPRLRGSYKKRSEAIPN